VGDEAGLQQPLLRLRRQPLHTFDVDLTVGYCVVGQLVAYNDLEALIEHIEYKPPVCPSTLHSQVYRPLLGQLTNRRQDGCGGRLRDSYLTGALPPPLVAYYRSLLPSLLPIQPTTALIQNWHDTPHGGFTGRWSALL
jgi:hypothetical protein